LCSTLSLLEPCSTLRPKPKIIPGAQYITMAQVRRIAALRVFSSAWQMSAELVASAHKTVHISPSRDGARLGFDGAILIERAFAELAPVIWQCSPQSFLPHRASAALPLIAVLALPRNKHTRAAGRRGRALQSTYPVPRQIRAAGSGGRPSLPVSALALFYSECVAEQPIVCHPVHQFCFN
jgi:hypothetical protein